LATSKKLYCLFAETIIQIDMCRLTSDATSLIVPNITTYFFRCHNCFEVAFVVLR